MMAGRIPGVIVSSTYYDLRQVRTDLAHFIERDLGYRPLISEHNSFPIDPDVNAIDNCRRRVEQDADILVLLIGGRYGSLESSSGKSVTNIEYLAARAKGIPVYAFVEKRTLALFEVWQADKTVSLAGLVDAMQLFAFLEEVRVTHQVWTTPFEVAQDITSTLRTQFGYMMTTGLDLQRRFHRSPDHEIFQSLGPKAFRYAIEKPVAWEYRLFAQCLIDAIDARAHLRLAHRRALNLGSGEHLQDIQSFAGWASNQLVELNRLTGAASGLLNDKSGMEEAFGPSGVPGNPKAIILLARMVADVYQEAIEWAQRLRRTHCPQQAKAAMDALSAFSLDLIEKLEGFGPWILRDLEEALQTAANGKRVERQIVLQITIDPTAAKRFSEAIKQLEAEMI
jgi:hypothetical protein